MKRKPTPYQRDLLLYAEQHGRVVYVWQGTPPLDVRRLQAHGWVDKTGVLTDAGRAVLHG